MSKQLYDDIPVVTESEIKGAVKRLAGNKITKDRIVNHILQERLGPNYLNDPRYSITRSAVRKEMGLRRVRDIPGITCQRLK